MEQCGSLLPYVFSVFAGRANGARTLVRRKIGRRRSLEISKRGSALPAFLRDKIPRSWRILGRGAKQVLAPADASARASPRPPPPPQSEDHKHPIAPASRASQAHSNTPLLHLPASLHHHLRERRNVGLEQYQDSHQARQREAVEENVSEDLVFVPVPVGRGAGDDDALGV